MNIAQPRTPFPATLTNSQSVSFPVAVTFPQPSPAPIRPLRNLRTANAIPSKPASAAPPHRSLNDTSTVNVAATVQTFEAQTPQTHPVKASVPPPQRGWVRRLVDRFTRVNAYSDICYIRCISHHLSSNDVWLYYVLCQAYTMPSRSVIALSTCTPTRYSRNSTSFQRHVVGVSVTYTSVGKEPVSSNLR